MKNLNKLTKNELIKMLKTILKDHPEYFFSYQGRKNYIKRSRESLKSH